MPTPESSPEYREAIESASKEWKNSLLDVGGNNRLLYFKQTSGQLDLKKANEEALQQLLGGKSVPVTRLFPGFYTRSRCSQSLPKTGRKAEGSCRRIWRVRNLSSSRACLLGWTHRRDDRPRPGRRVQSKLKKTGSKCSNILAVGLNRTQRWPQ